MAKLTVAAVNEQLKTSMCRVRLEQAGNKLYLRGTLPPKPDSGQTKWKQQRIPLGCNASPEGLKKSRTLAFAVSASLESGDFCWETYIETKPPQEGNGGESVSDAIAKFEKAYFETRPDNPTTRNTYKKHYTYYFSMLPRNSSLSKELLIQTILKKTAADSCKRHNCYIAYNYLSREILGTELGSPNLKGKYQTKAVDPEDLPSDELIAQTRDYTLRNPHMEACYTLMAIYGLRPSECFWVDPNSLKDPDGVIRVQTHKTKGQPYWRWVYPSRPDWVAQWDVPSLIVPESKGTNNNSKGATITKFFGRHPNIPFTPYILRHAYAARLARKNVDTAIAAKWMGHSNAIHCQTYHKFLDRQHFDDVFKKYVQPG